MPPTWFADTIPVATPADLAACRELLRGGSRSFHVASLLLPRAVREPASALYAFCRVADDAIDLGGDARTLARLRDRLDRAYRGQPLPIPADRALAETVARFDVPRVLLEALLEGFSWDAEGRRYADLPALEAYAARVAGTVGAMMAAIMGVRAPAVVARACDLGIAMQLSNIARDVGEDARAGRLYLPLDWLREAGLDPQGFLADPRPGAALAGVVRRLLDHAAALYARAESGIARLPRGCRPGIRAARLLYAAIGDEVARLGPEAALRRAVVPSRRKALLLARALVAPPARLCDEPALEAAGFLVDAVAAARPIHRDPRLPDRGEQVRWVIGLFEHLERRETMLRGR